jgi:hypothetical protein
MSTIDERLMGLDIALPDVMPPVVDGYVPAFAPFVRFGSVTKFNCPAALARRMVSPFVGRWARILAWKKARLPHEGWLLSCWLCSKPPWAILITFDES